MSLPVSRTHALPATTVLTCAYAPNATGCSCPYSKPAMAENAVPRAACALNSFHPGVASLTFTSRGHLTRLPEASIKVRHLLLFLPPRVEDTSL